MRFFQAGLILVGVAWLLLVGGTLFWNFAPSANFLGIGTSASARVQGHSPSSVGSDRYSVLLEATRHFKERGVEVSRGVAEGTELAPVTYLNRQLERQGVKWRVRSTDGHVAEIYEIS